MTTLEQTLTMEHDGAVLTLTLNRPDVLNAFDDALLDRLAAAIRTADRDPAVRALIVTGAGRAFSAGQDLRALQDRTANAQARAAAVGQHLREKYNPIIWRLRTIEKPVVAAINGVAAGAGMSLALACDLRLAADNASFAPGFVRIGLVPDSGATAFLPALVGLARAAELAFTGDRLAAARALELGLVNRVVPADELLPAARELAARLAALPTKAIGLTKRAFNRAVAPDLADHLAYEAQLQEIAAATADHAEGVAAFRDKREPRFTGQ